MKPDKILFAGVIFVILFPLCSHARVVVDMTGRAVEVPEKITRVASPYRIATEMIFSLGEQEKLVGVSTLPGHVMEMFYPEIKNAGLADRHSSAEELLKLRPEIVFSSPAPWIDALEKAGVRVFCIVVEDPESMLKGLEMIGDVLGKKDRAGEISDYCRKKLEYIRNETSSIEPKKKVYLVGARPLTTVGGDFYQNFIVDYAGGLNVAGDLHGGWVSVSREHLVAWNPDVMVTIPYSTKDPELLVEDPGLSMVSAVKNREIYSFPMYIDSWDLPTPESILGIMWLANTLYPEKVRFDMEKEARAFYERFYGRYPVPVDFGGKL